MPSTDAFTAARRHMVDSQLRPNRVTDDRVVDAMLAVPREAFVPAAYRGVAYMDEDVPLAAGRFLLEPLTLGRLLQTAEPVADDVVLDVGGGTGYSAAVLSRLVAKVVALESDPSLTAETPRILAALGVANVTLIGGELEKGAAAHGPYSLIVLNGSVDFIPDELSRQLTDGGRLVAVVMVDGVGEAVIVRRTGDLFARRTVFNANVGHLPGFRREAGFVF